MASKKPIKKSAGKKAQKPVAKAAKKLAKPAAKAVKPTSKPAKKSGKKKSKDAVPKKQERLSRFADDEDIQELEEELDEVGSDDEAPDEAALAKGADVAEREASRLDLEEVAKQADRQENRQGAEGDGTEGVATEEQLALAGVVPPSSRPTTANSDEYDPESVDAMADFKARSVLGAEERNAVIQEVKQAAEKNGGYVTYEQLNSIVPQTVQDESTTD